jgi:hypothetical protein
MKSAEEIMEILEAYDLTGSFRDAAELAGCSHHTVAFHVAARDAGGGVAGRPAARRQLIDEFLGKVEEWVEHSKGRIRADKAHEKLLALGFCGSERTTRRAVAAVKMMPLIEIPQGCLAKFLSLGFCQGSGYRGGTGLLSWGGWTGSVVEAVLGDSAGG